MKEMVGKRCACQGPGFYSGRQPTSCFTVHLVFLLQIRTCIISATKSAHRKISGKNLQKIGNDEVPQNATAD
jgi:hypothetical protein